LQSIEQANLDLMKGLLSAFATRSFSDVGRIISADVELHFPGRNKFSGAYKGISEAVRLLALISQWLGDETRVQVHDVLANEQHGVMLYVVTARHEDRSITYRYVDVYHFRDGCITEIWGQCVDDPAAFDAFYSD